MDRKRVIGVILGLLLILTPGIAAKTKKIKKIRASANPPQYIAFSRLLSKDEELHHALDRLTFGPRPGDLDRLCAMGIEQFVDRELRPDRIPENPLLAERLAPLETLRMSARETYLHYPAPQLIRQVARGKGRLPDDPELRAVVLSLAQRYLDKQEQGDAGIVAAPAPMIGAPVGVLSLNTSPETQLALEQQAAKQQDPNDDSDLILKVNLASFLTRSQIEILHTGTPEEKRAVLSSVPEDRMTDFAGALRVRERNQLIGLAPVELRRKLQLFNAPQQVVASDLVEGKLLRAIYSNHQLEELMVDFWYNHFNVFLNKGGERYLVATYERESIRPYVFAKFKDLLLATAKSPAMLFYLDNAESVAPQVGDNSPRQLPKKPSGRGLNENYGRELLELHTLGVDGGYTQDDVIAVARCFTGWTLSGPRKGDTFQFNEKVHDRGSKVVLGVKIPAGGGMSDGLKVIDILAHRPATAHFISLKLAQWFVADDPPPSLLNRMAETFENTDGDIREVMRTMLSSPEFWSHGAYQAKFKSPFEMIVSAVRATDADVTSAFLLGNAIQRLGEPLYRKVEPTGYSSANAEWVSSAALLDRMNFALALAHNRVAGVKVNMDQWAAMTARDPMELARYLLERDPTEQTRQAIEKALTDQDLQKQLAANAKAGPPQAPSVVAGLVIGSPDFQRR